MKTFRASLAVFLFVTGICLCTKRTSTGEVPQQIIVLSLGESYTRVVARR